MVVQTCRCCCGTMRLEKAAKVIGIVLTILCAISVVVWGVKLSELETADDLLNTSNDKLNPAYDQLDAAYQQPGVTSDERQQLDAARDKLDFARDMVKNVQQLLVQSRKLQLGRLCGEILCFLFSTFLTLGAYKRNKHLVLSFFIFFVVYTSANTIFTFYLLYDPTIIIGQAPVTAPQTYNVEAFKIGAYIGLALVLALNAFYFYLSVVVYSYYKELLSGPALEKEVPSVKC